MLDSCSKLDKLLIFANNTLTTLFSTPTSTRPTPKSAASQQNLTKEEIKHSAGLMRINHAGEVCAQALYQGQALTARNPAVKEAMYEASIEENDHLNWCSERLKNLDSHTSWLNPIWYSASFVIGVGSGLLGDKWNLGFLAETEKQVCQHLKSHLDALPENDEESHAILKQMAIDEAKHENMAIEQGAAPLPFFVKKAMGLFSKVMTQTSYHL